MDFQIFYEANFFKWYKRTSLKEYLTRIVFKEAPALARMSTWFKITWFRMGTFEKKSFVTPNKIQRLFSAETWRPFFGHLEFCSNHICPNNFVLTKFVLTILLVCPTFFKTFSISNLGLNLLSESQCWDSWQVGRWT